jgi:hypothetical protein
MQELNRSGSTFDVIRRRYLKMLSEYTGRNVIAYYSGWLQKPQADAGYIAITDADKNGFMNAIHGMDRKKGLDLILHTPGGDTAATESLVDYLHSMFGNNIRAIVPQLAMSAGTMIACACKEIIMGEQSNLGPIDPQFNGMPAHAVLEEFDKACDAAQHQPWKIPIWQPIISRYNPTFIVECTKVITWSNEMVSGWLRNNMFLGVPTEEQERTISTVLQELGDHSVSKSHARHLSKKKCVDMGLKIIDMESDQTLQDNILSIHHACIHTLAGTPAVKLIENHDGIAFIQRE